MLQELLDTLDVTTQYTPAAAAGSHAVTYAVSAALTDDSPSDNGAMDSFEIVASTGTYGRDRGVYEGQGGGEDELLLGILLLKLEIQRKFLLINKLLVLM